MPRSQESGLLDLVVGSRWSVAAWRAGAVFIAGYVIPPLLFSRGGHVGGLVSAIQILATLFAFVFTAAALFAFALARDAADGNSSDESGLDSLTVMEPAAWSAELLRQIEWKQLSALCKALYEEKGFRVVATTLGTDGGISLRLYQDENEQPAAIAQCRAWGDLRVDVEPVQALLAVMNAEQISKAFYMTPGRFADDARALAMANHITPVDGKLLLAMVNRLPGETRQQLLHEFTAGDYTTPTCPGCGLKMIASSNELGPCWGCRAFPRCKHTLALRAEAA